MKPDFSSTLVIVPARGGSKEFQTRMCGLFQDNL